VPLLESDERAFVDFLREDSPCVAILSPTAVFAFKEAVARASLPMPDIRFASQGPGTTRAIRECFGVDPFFEASRSSAEEFVEELLHLSSCPRSLLIPQSAIGREVMGPLLRAAGVSVLELITYTMVTQRPPADEQENLRAVAAAGGFILFMSPSAVQATVETVDQREDLDRLRVISIGPTTSKAAQAFGVVVAAEASESTEEGVLRALQRAAAHR
jgi:uroporphyrinogen III methyltransferase/synthase